MKYLLIIVALLLSVTAYGEEPKDASYVCIGDMSTGFRFNEGRERWEQKDFRTVKYLVSKSEKKSLAWEVTEVGKSHVIYACKDDFDKNGFLSCTSKGSFLMNKFSGRFVKTYTFAYYNFNPNDGAMEKSGRDPLIEIGKCSSL